MRKKYFSIVWLLILFLSCSSNDPEVLPPEPASFEQDILGQWVVEFNEEEAFFTTRVKRDYLKQSEDNHEFRVLNLVFRKNSQYHLISNKGNHSGYFEFIDNSNISLSGLGTLSNVEIKEDTISATLVFDDGSQAPFSGSFRNEYKDGDCVSFLECYDGKYWLRRYTPFPAEDLSLVYYDFLTFKNDVSGLWWINTILNEDEGCIVSKTDNLLEDAEFTILAHSSHLLIFRKETADEAFLYKYFLDEKDFSGGLHLQIVNIKDAGTISYRYVSRENKEIPVFEEYPDCEQEEEKIYVPDDVFEQKLIQLGWDDVPDDYILKSKAEGITELSLNVPLTSNIEKIRDLSGIDGFVNLKKLNVENNDISAVNISSLEKLEELNFNKNKLTTLDCSGNKNLFSLKARENQITKISVSGNPLLWNLELAGNLLESINLSNNTNLNDLMLGNNLLTSIDLSHNTALWDLTLNDNRLTFLDLSNHKELWYLGASNNQLTDLDLTEAASLQFLSLNNNSLTEIDLTGLISLQEINIDHNKLDHLVFEEKPEMYLIYAEGNQFSRLDVSSMENEHLHISVRNNPLECIQVNNAQLANHSSWKFDETVRLSLECE